MAAESRWRPGLRARLLAGTVLVAMCSIAATAWLAVRGTTGTIESEQGQNQATVTAIYDRVLAFAATHPGWAGVAPVLADLGRETGLRIGLTTGNRVPIAGDFGAGDPPPQRPAAVVDPLAVDITRVPEGADDRIDRRAVGPLRLLPAEADEVRREAEEAAACLRSAGVPAEVVSTPAGRSYARAAAGGGCGGLVNAEPVARLTATEQQAMLILDSYVDTCLRERAIAPYKVLLTADGGFAPGDPTADGQVFYECLAKGRGLLLGPYVAQPALLFVSAPVVVGLPAAGAAQIAGAAAVVLVLTVAVSALLARPVLRSLRAVTAATQRMRAGDRAARARVRDRGEVAELAAAFNEMAEHLAQVERQRTDLVNDVSHELRTPLSTVRGWLVAAQDGVAEVDAEFVESLLEEVMVLQQLVDDLQELAAADAGELRLSPEPVDVGVLLTQLAATAGHAAEVAVSTGGDLRAVVDPVRLRQAVGNLLSNAIRHTPPGGRIALRAEGDADEVVIAVSDTGAGIAAEDLPHVFDRFWRADRARARATGGRGLGLAITRQLVAAHGGTVSVTSAPGVGSTFTVRLPRGV